MPLTFLTANVRQWLTRLRTTIRGTTNMDTMTKRKTILHHQIRGKGPTLLLLNGLGLSSEAWEPQMAALSDTLRLLAPDNRGSGRSELGGGPCTIADMAGDVISLLDALGLDRVHVLGLSMGGLIAQELALRHPKRVRSLILVATAARLPPMTRHVIDVWSRMVQHGVDTELFLREQFGWVFTDHLLEQREVVDGMIAMVRTWPFSAPGFMTQVKACLGHDAVDRVPAILVPSLVLVGREERLIPIPASEELASLLPNARLKILEEGGHGFAAECAGAFNQAVLDFVRDVETERC